MPSGRLVAADLGSRASRCGQVVRLWCVLGRSYGHVVDEFLRGWHGRLQHPCGGCNVLRIGVWDDLDVHDFDVHDFQVTACSVPSATAAAAAAPATAASATRANASSSAAATPTDTHCHVPESGDVQMAFAGAAVSPAESA